MKSLTPATEVKHSQEWSIVFESIQRVVAVDSTFAPGRFAVVIDG